MTVIYLVRHGETALNVTDTFRGRKDIELNERGIAQAESAAKYLSKLEIEAVYSSPMKRAMQTAEAIARPHKLKVTATQGLIDLDFGQWEGLSHEEVSSRYTDLYRLWLNHPEKVIMPGGESLEDVRARAVSFVDETVRKHTGTAVLVSHRVVNQVLTCALLGLDNSHFWNVRQDTAAMTVFLHEQGRYVLIKHNETCHLKD